jgi:hypothetical protein
MQEFSALDGALLIDKPAGPTSHDVVDAIRRRFQIKKVGHCGTLDPNATGLLIIVLGRGTKLSEKLMGDDKVYEGAIKFGETTDSYDADGELTGSLPVMCRFTNWRAKELKLSVSRGWFTFTISVSPATNCRSAHSKSPAPRALMSAASRMILARNSAAARIWRRCDAVFPASLTWRMRCRWTRF